MDQDMQEDDNTLFNCNSPLFSLSDNSTSSTSGISSRKVNFDSNLGASSSIMAQKMIYKSLNTPISWKIENDTRIFTDARARLIDWILEIGDEFQLRVSTMHLAVAYLDKTFSNLVNINGSGIQANLDYPLLALSCILIAAKFEESESSAPSPFALSQFTQEAIPATDICRMELNVLQFIEWELQLVTSSHLLQYFLAKGLLFHDDAISISSPTSSGNNLRITRKHTNGARTELEALPKYCEKYVLFFSEMSLQYYQFQKYPSAIVAGAIVAAMREVLNIEPRWRSELSLLSGLTFKTISPCLQEILSVFQNDFAKQHQNGHYSPTMINEAI